MCIDQFNITSQPTPAQGQVNGFRPCGSPSPCIHMYKVLTASQKGKADGMEPKSSHTGLVNPYVGEFDIQRLINAFLLRCLSHFNGRIELYIPLMLAFSSQCFSL